MQGDAERAIHVTVPGGARKRPGINVHRSRTLTPDQMTRRDNVPVTTPSRTLADLRRLLPRAEFGAALRQAEYLRLPIDPALQPDRTRSELERRFLAVCRRHRLPKPAVNVTVGPFVVDFAWPGPRLIVELDGYRAHGTRSAFEADRARDARLKLEGWDVIRVTWRQIANHPGEIVDVLRVLLTRP